jgi:hypothetical protein
LRGGWHTSPGGDGLGGATGGLGVGPGFGGGGLDSVGVVGGRVPPQEAPELAASEGVALWRARNKQNKKQGARHTGTGEGNADTFFLKLKENTTGSCGAWSRQ